MTLLSSIITSKAHRNSATIAMVALALVSPAVAADRVVNVYRSDYIDESISNS